MWLRQLVVCTIFREHADHRRRLRGGRGGHVPTAISNLNFVPTTFKNVQTNCDQKNPHILNRNRQSLNHAIGAMTSSQHAHQQSGTAHRPAVIPPPPPSTIAHPPPPPSTIAHCGGYMVIVPTTSKTKLTPQMPTC